MHSKLNEYYTVSFTTFQNWKCYINFLNCVFTFMFVMATSKYNRCWNVPCVSKMTSILFAEHEILRGTNHCLRRLCASSSQRYWARQDKPILNSAGALDLRRILLIYLCMCWDKNLLQIFALNTLFYATHCPCEDRIVFHFQRYTVWPKGSVRARYV